MSIDNAVMSLAGVVTLVGLALGWFVSPWWLLLVAFVGLNLVAAGITGLLPGGDDLQAARPEVGLRVHLSGAAAVDRQHGVASTFM